MLLSKASPASNKVMVVLGLTYLCKLMLWLDRSGCEGKPGHLAVGGQLSHEVGAGPQGVLCAGRVTRPHRGPTAWADNGGLQIAGPGPGLHV